MLHSNHSCICCVLQILRLKKIARQHICSENNSLEHTQWGWLLKIVNEPRASQLRYQVMYIRGDSSMAWVVAVGTANICAAIRSLRIRPFHSGTVRLNSHLFNQWYTWRLADVSPRPRSAFPAEPTQQCLLLLLVLLNASSVAIQVPRWVTARRRKATAKLRRRAKVPCGTLEKFHRLK